MITSDLKRVSQELSSLIDALEPLGLVNDTMREDALDFSRCIGFVKLRYLNYEYVTDLAKRVEHCELTDVPVKVIQTAKLAIILFGQEILNMEFELLTESLKQVNESVGRG
jgi:hypothetical protein